MIDYNYCLKLFYIDKKINKWIKKNNNFIKLIILSLLIYFLISIIDIINIIRDINEKKLRLCRT